MGWERKPTTSPKRARAWTPRHPPTLDPRRVVAEADPPSRRCSSWSGANSQCRHRAVGLCSLLTSQVAAPCVF